MIKLNLNKLYNEYKILKLEEDIRNNYLKDSESLEEIEKVLNQKDKGVSTKLTSTPNYSNFGNRNNAGNLPNINVNRDSIQVCGQKASRRGHLCEYEGYTSQAESIITSLGPLRDQVKSKRDEAASINIEIDVPSNDQDSCPISKFYQLVHT